MHNVKQIGFVFYAEAGNQFTAIPEAKELVNSFDLIGDIVSLRRNKLEKNAEYKQRIIDVNVNPGSAVYSGVINNLLRDLSLNREKAIEIGLKLTSGGEPIASNPKVEFFANRVVLYKSWIPGQTPEVDLEIRTYKPTDSGYYLTDLIDLINTSECFTAMAFITRAGVLSSNLIRVSSLAEITDELIQTDYRTKLVGEYLISTTVEFSEKPVFKNETLSRAVEGDYTVDYIEGIVYNYSLPSGNSFVSYMYNIFPLDVEYCDIQLFTLSDEDFTSELFDKEFAPSGEEINGLLNPEGAEIYHTVYKNNKIFWGQ
jgi:hypothetical protein